MIVLTSTANEDSRKLAVESFVSMGFSPDMLTMMENAWAAARDNFLEGDLIASGVPFRGNDLIGDNGVEYEELTFQPSSVYTKDGERWVAGEGFEINITQHMNTVDPIFQESLAAARANGA